MARSLRMSEEESKKLRDISINILDAIIKTSKRNEEALSTLLGFIQSKTINYGIGLDMLISDKKATAIAHYSGDIDPIIEKEKNGTRISYADSQKLQEYHDFLDYKTMLEMKDALDDGLLVNVSSLLLHIKDDFVKDILKADLKDLMSFSDKFRQIAEKMTSEQKVELSECVAYVNKDGIINMKEVVNFNQKDFENKIAFILEDPLDSKKSNPESHEDPENDYTLRLQ